MKKTIISVTSWSQFSKSQCVNEMMLWTKRLWVWVERNLALLVKLNEIKQNFFDDLRNLVRNETNIVPLKIEMNKN